MSAAISAADNARSYIRTSSIVPRKNALATLQIPPDGSTPAKVRLNAP